jgi:hypothetical protein
MAKARVPDIVINDLVTFLDDLGINRMDTNERLCGKDGVYGLEVDGYLMEFHGVELAPPQGMLGLNYARYVCPLTTLCPQHFSNHSCLI